MMLPIPSPTPGGNARGVSILSSRRVKTRSGGNLFLTGKLYVVFLRWASWWLSDKESACQCKRCGINLWVGKIPWRRIWQPSLVFLLGNSMDRGSWWAKVHGVTKET